MLKCAVFLGDIRWGIFFSNRLVGELCELVDVMYILYAKPHGSMIIFLLKTFVHYLSACKLIKILMYLIILPRRRWSRTSFNIEESMSFGSWRFGL